MPHSGKAEFPGGHSIKTFDTQSDPIAIALKRLHEEVESEAIPSEFLELLAAIDSKMDRKAKSE